MKDSSAQENPLLVKHPSTVAREYLLAFFFFLIFLYFFSIFDMYT